MHSIYSIFTSDIYFNFFSVSAMISFSMSTAYGVYFVALPSKSRATLYLGIAFLMIACMSFGYIFGSSLYHPYAAYHRWLTVFGGLLLTPAITQFLLHYPRVLHPRLTGWLLIVQLVLVSVVGAVFYGDTLGSGYRYFFAGHYWDFRADTGTRLVGLMILVNTFVMLFSGIYQVVRTSGRGRWSALAMLLVLGCAGLAQGVTNSLSREGLIGRDAFQTTYSITVIVGFFAVVVIYINNTRDRTSFMAKIIGISLVTLLLLLQGISYYSLRDRDEAYDELRRERMELALFRNARPEDLEYLHRVEIDANVAGVRGIYANRESEIRFSEDDRAEQSREAYNGFAFQRVRAAEDAAAVEDFLTATPRHFAGWAGLIREQATGSPAALIERVRAAARPVRYHWNKIRRLPDENFRPAVKAYVAGQTGDAGEAFHPFGRAVSDHLSQDSRDGAELKSALAAYFTPMLAPEDRRYRTDAEQNKHYAAFQYVGRADGRPVVYEAGFAYRSYRSYADVAAARFAVLLGVVLFVVLILFRFFFHGALVSPLNALLAGVRQVNEGDLDVEVPVKVEDEIGFLAHSFNGMVSSIRDARAKLEEYAGQLEDKVRERTAELEQSLGRVQQLKTQQDGDYFLTSLLIRPLSTNHAEGRFTDVDFYLEQKKKFRFRRWADELGGDVCIAHTIELVGRRYIAFINADAMGKSMQGAGGVLVLGAVFEALIERTHLSGETRRRFPERWMKNSFVELHKVFETFDGSMLVSLVLGLVDDEAGLIYYINAEHPWSVLYRGGQARFIEKDTHFRKLGTLGVEGQITIHTLQLEPGDVFIAGSDGRDDIRLATKEGVDVMQEDETQFLHRVEEADGVLERIVHGIKDRGELTDDLSLLRIAYKEDLPLPAEEPERAAEIHRLRETGREALGRGDPAGAVTALKEARSLDAADPGVLRSLAIAYQQKKAYRQAAAVGEEYARLRPVDTEMLYLTSVCYRKCNRLESAADYGERVRLRDHGHVRNLVNLGRIYAKMRLFGRAETMLERALEHEPGHAKAGVLLANVRSVKTKAEEPGQAPKLNVSTTRA